MKISGANFSYRIVVNSGKHTSRMARTGAESPIKIEQNHHEKAKILFCSQHSSDQESVDVAPQRPGHISVRVKPRKQGMLRNLDHNALGSKGSSLDTTNSTHKQLRSPPDHVVIVDNLDIKHV